MRRDLVALAILVLAVVVALPYIISNNDGEAADPLSTSTPVPSVTPTTRPAPTATPVPDQGVLEPPPVWSVKFYRELSGTRREDDTVLLEEIDLAFETPPFGEYRDGSWGLVASAGWGQRAAGRYILKLEYDCALKVTSGDETITELPDPPGPEEAEIEVLHKGGILNISIDAHDSPGPFLLRQK